MNAGADILKHAAMRMKVGDWAIFLFINRQLECRFLDFAMLMLSALGSLPFTAALSVGLLVFDIPALPNLGLNLVATLIIGQIGVQVVKRLVNRPRPYTVSEQAHPKKPPACAYSFPSGHTYAAFSIALALAQSRPSLGFLALMIAGLVGVSRVYLGVHYPSDVVCSSAVAYLAHLVQVSV